MESGRLTRAERFLLACNELGWGDGTKNGLWFFGMEERLPWEPGQESRIEDHYGHDKYFRDREVESALYGEGRKYPKRDFKPSDGDFVEAKICAELSTSRMPENDILKNIVNVMPGTGIAHGNLYPLGKPGWKSTFPPHYLDLFGYGPGDMAQYRKDVARHRFPRIRDARKELSPKAIVCFGVGCWPEFREVFGLSGPADPKRPVYEEDRVILAYHWSFNNLKEADIQWITVKLKEWGVTVP